jgi:hypothetical protein
MPSTKSEMIERIEVLEDVIISASDERDKLKNDLHEIECDERNEYLESIKDQPLKDIREMCAPDDYNDEKWEIRAKYLDTIAELHSIKNCHYSCYENDLGAIAREGKVLLCHGDDDNEYTQAMENPTWLDIWKFADIAIYKVDDHHHIFLEGLFTGKFANIFHLSMGS